MVYAAPKNIKRNIPHGDSKGTERILTVEANCELGCLLIYLFFFFVKYVYTIIIMSMSFPLALAILDALVRLKIARRNFVGI